MWRAQNIIIVSDLHIAAERERGLFQADSELVEFLNWIRTTTQQSLVLLNGDILDYLVVKEGVAPEMALDLPSVQARTTDIIEHHPEVFDALARLACSPEHQLVIMGGNHDPELAFPEVQQIIEARLNSAAPKLPLRWLTLGTAARVQVGGTVVVIEHGDILDPWNRVDFDALSSTIRLSSRGLISHHRYQPPPGSKLVIEHLYELRKDYPWVDLLKPEREAVFPLLRHFMSGMQQLRFMGAVKNWFWSFEKSVVSGIQATINPSARYRAAGEATDTSRDRFKQWLLDYESGNVRGLTSPGDAGFIEELRQVSAEDGFFNISKPDDSKRDVEFVIEQGADLVVHGHTHSAKAYTVGMGLYLNSGTWARLLQLPMSYDADEVWQKFLAGLKPKSKISGDGEVQNNGLRDGAFLRPTFVYITCIEKGEASTASLHEWKEIGPIPLSSWRFDLAQRAWREER